MRKKLFLHLFILGWSMIGYSFNVTFQLDMSNVSGFITPEVNGTFNNWCGACAPMADDNNDGIWEISIDLPAGTYEYKFAADNWNIQEALSAGSPCTVTNSGFTNRTLTVTADAALPVVCWGACTSCNNVFPVTFQVDMNAVIPSFTLPTVNGSFNGWSGNAHPLSDNDGDGIWETTINLAPGDYEYKFAADNWALQENLVPGSACTVTNFGFTNRSLVIANSSQVLSVVCFGACTACNQAPNFFDVTFQLDMSTTTGFGTPEVNGTFNGWCGNCNAMTDADGDGIWTTTISLQPGNYEFKYSYDNWAGQENLIEGSACTVTNNGFTNRSITVSEDVTLNSVCFGSCTSCQPTNIAGCTDNTAYNYNLAATTDDGSCLYSTEFNVDMNCADLFTTVHITGPWCGWCGGETYNTLSDLNNDGVFNITLYLPQGNVEYKYMVDNFIAQENLIDDAINGSTCAANTDFATYANRMTTAGSSNNDTYDQCVSCNNNAWVQMTLPVSFEENNVQYGLIGFGGAEDSQIIVDPADANQHIARVVKSSTAATWAGTTITVPDPIGFAQAIPFTATETFMNVRVWTPSAGTPVRLKVEDHTDPTHSVETQVNTTLAGEWETLNFNFGNEAPGTAALNLNYTFDMASIFFNYGTEGAVAGETTYYFDDVQFGAANGGVSSASVTFQVDMNNVNGFTTPEVNGTFNNWCGNCNAMTDANGDGIWEATIALNPGSYEYKYAFDNWLGQEVLTTGSACTVTNSGFTNRSLHVTGDTTLSVVCWESCTSCQNTPNTSEVKFQVDMSNVTGFVLPELNGTFNNWCGNCATLSDGNGDNIWDIIVYIPMGTYEYKFSFDNWTGQENLLSNLPCTVTNFGFTNRSLTVTGDTTLSVVCWESCTSCQSTPETFDVTFQVDMSTQTGFTTPEVNGTFNNWCGSCFTMNDNDGDGIWTATTQLPAGDYAYKFSFDNWTGQESLTVGDPCTFTSSGFTNRSLSVTGDLILPVVCWSSCSACVPPTAYPVIFSVDVNGANATSVEISGNFNDFCSGCETMHNENESIWKDTLFLTPGVYEFYYTLNNGATIESLSDNVCTVNNNGNFHRIVTITDSTNIGLVCWEQCAPCTVNVEDRENNNTTLYPNPAKNIINLQHVSPDAHDFKIYNSMGQFMPCAWINSSHSIDISQLAAGNYCIQWLTQNTTRQITFIKE